MTPAPVAWMIADRTGRLRGQPTLDYDLARECAEACNRTPDNRTPYSPVPLYAHPVTAPLPRLPQMPANPTIRGATVNTPATLPARFNTGTYKMSPELWADILTVLTKGYGYRHIAPVGEGGQIVATAYTGDETGYRWWLLTDNGGEVRVQPINREDPNIPDVPLTRWGYGLDAGTLAVNIALTIKGEPIDYAADWPELVEEVRMSPNTPDTSPANIARVLREAATRVDALAHKDIRKSFGDRNFAANECRALADALDRQPAPMTWGERVRIAVAEFERQIPRQQSASNAMSLALAKSFPESAPSDD